MYVSVVLHQFGQIAEVRVSMPWTEVTTRASEIVFNKYNVEYSQNEVLYFDK
jgi:hypothetical protein